MAMRFGLDETLGFGSVLPDDVALPAIRGISPHPRLLTMQQLRHHVAVMDIRRRGCYGVNQLRSAVDTNMCLHAEMPLLPLLGLMHLRIPLLRTILRRTRGGNNGGIHNRPAADLEPVGSQVRTDPRKELLAQLMGFQQMPKLTDRRLVGYRL